MLNSSSCQSGSDEIYTMLRLAKINVEATRAGNPLDRWLVVMALIFRWAWREGTKRFSAVGA